VVEHSIGNGEVDSSILSGSTTASAKTIRISNVARVKGVVVPRSTGSNSVARNTRSEAKIKASFRFD
jgi:hypothetical protein